MAKVVELVEAKNDDRLVLLVCVKRDKSLGDDADVLKGAKVEAVKAGVVAETLTIGQAVRCKLSDATWLAQRSKRWHDHPLMLEVQEENAAGAEVRSAKDQKKFDALVAKAVAAGVSETEARAMTLEDLAALAG